MNTEVTVSKSEVLLSKLTKLIAAQTAGEQSGFSTEDLHHCYMSLVEGVVDVATHDLLVQILGADWDDGWEPAITEEDIDQHALNMVITESLEQLNCDEPQEVVGALASALMVACRELGWLEASRAAHDQWFYVKNLA